MFGKPKQAVVAAARGAQYAQAQAASASSLAEFGGRGVAEALGREAERYLTLVLLLREGKDERWVPSSMPEWLELGGRLR